MVVVVFASFFCSHAARQGRAETFFSSTTSICISSFFPLLMFFFLFPYTQPTNQLGPIQTRCAHAPVEGFNECVMLPVCLFAILLACLPAPSPHLFRRLCLLLLPCCCFCSCASCSFARSYHKSNPRTSVVPSLLHLCLPKDNACRSTHVSKTSATRQRAGLTPQLSRKGEARTCAKQDTRSTSRGTGEGYPERGANERQELAAEATNERGLDEGKNLAVQ